MTEVGVVRVRMRSGVVFLQFICGSYGRRAQVLRLQAGRIICGRCTGPRYWCEGKPAVRRAQHRIELLKATRFHSGSVSHRPGRTMERRAELMASLRRSEAVVRRRFAGRILAALQVTDPEPKLNPGSSRRLKSTLPKPTRSPENPLHSQYDDFLRVANSFGSDSAPRAQRL